MDERLMGLQDINIVEEYFPSLIDRAVDIYDYNYKCLWVKVNDGKVYFIDKLNRSIRLASEGAKDMTDERYLKEFSVNLRNMLRINYMSQKRLSELTGISIYTINRFLNGKQLPDILQIGKIASAIRYPVHILTNFYDLAR